MASRSVIVRMPTEQRSPDHWFADHSDPEDVVNGAPWQPFIQIIGGCFPLPIWFATEAECEAFIATIPRGAATSSDETDRLLRWKAEALPLLDLLDRCHDLLPEDARAPLGHSKAGAVEAYLASVSYPKATTASEVNP